jgi:MoCo/4Fe-4S cofactor protein with predicted Tat translocation signal
VTEVVNRGRKHAPPPQRALWRSLAELGEEGSAQRGGEFAPGADEPPDSVARRDFFRLVGASAALAGASACNRATREKLRPYVTPPPEVVPGNPLFFASSMALDGYAIGVVVESHEGHPTKIEGNPDHPASLGATGPIEQASILDLYDPDRARGITRAGQPRSWPAFAETFAPRLRTGSTHLLLAATSSPLVADQVARLRARHPSIDVRWHAPLAPTTAWEGSRIAFGHVLEPRVRVAGARVIVALDSDFLAAGPAWRVIARDFADARRLRTARDEMSRLYAVEPALSITGMSADHRLRVRAREVMSIAAQIATSLAALGISLSPELLGSLAPWSARASAHASWTAQVARDLASHRGACVVLVGDGQPAEVHALGLALNAALGNVGRTIGYAPSPIVDAGSGAFDLGPLSIALESGEVSTLVVAGGNPAYTAFAELELARRMGRAQESVYVGPYVNESARSCGWFVPEAHYLESWGDGRAFEGTISLCQPVLAPHSERRTTSEILSTLLGEAPATSHDLLAAYWRRLRSDFEAEWPAWLGRGLIPGTGFDAGTPEVRFAAVADAILRLPLPPSAGPSLEVTLRRDARVHDGTYANNAWLMEMPDPTTRLTWGNAALLSRATAARLRVADGDLLRLEVGGRSETAPALVVPGHADDSIALSLGYGRTGDGEAIARGIGSNGYALRTRSGPSFAEGTAVATGGRIELALEQVHSSLEGRDDEILLHRTLSEYRRDPTFAKERDERPPSLYAHQPSGARQWGMVIDLNACTGCGSCVVACQAENNVPVVGKAGVAKGRAMHWLRIDRYFVGGPDDPQVVLEPMLCQHCEKAPCEYVCPVNATTHSADGLNQMVYNRCVGTRFCSNNCPYKVRRFNWFNYHQDEAAEIAAVHNPDVTVRARGVMEKCTYCVQRIREAEIRSEVSRRPMLDGDVVTACEQACPTRAITFGNIADPASRVRKAGANDRRFAVLNDLGTVPRTRYLARVRNPNPELA